MATYVDISDYIGEEILLRWRFGQSVDALSDPPNGWTLDDVEIMDMFNYHTEACVTSQEGDEACALAPGRGTVVEPGIPTGTEDEELVNSGLQVYPNPATDQLYIQVKPQSAGPATLHLFSLDGRLLRSREAELVGGVQTLSLPVGNLPSGMHFLKVTTGKEEFTEKVVVE